MDPNILPWLITRAAAVTSYVLLFLLIVMGETMATGKLYDFITPTRAWLWHKYLGISFAFALLAHMIFLLFDKFMPFGVLDILIPLHASYKPFFVALGTVGFYLFLIVMLSSLIARFQRSSWWRKLHFLVYPLFILGLAHGLFTGTDSKNIFMLVLYGLTGSIFYWLLLQRWKLARSRR